VLPPEDTPENGKCLELPADGNQSHVGICSESGPVLAIDNIPLHTMTGKVTLVPRNEIPA